MLDLQKVVADAKESEEKIINGFSSSSSSEKDPKDKIPKEGEKRKTGQDIVGNVNTIGLPLDEGIELNEGQRAALDSMKSGEDVFITGVAGTGKSTVVRAFLRWCEETGKKALVVAPTGIAANNVGGVTLHSQFMLHGVLDPNFYFPRYQAKMERDNESRWGAILEMDVLIMEEVSMIRYDYFERVMKILDGLHNLTGKKVQVIASGDFGQLSPILVFRKNEYSNHGLAEGDVFKKMFPHVGDEPWAFLSEYWNFDTYELREVMRQHDKEFVKALGKIRMGDRSGLDYINAHSATTCDEDSIFLCSTNKDVDDINKLYMDQLEGKVYEFSAEASGEASMADVLIDSPLRLKVGAKVMTVVNDYEYGYRNGSFGIVDDIHAYGDVPEIMVKFDSGKIVPVVPYTWEIFAYVQDGRGTGFRKSVVGKVTGLPLKLRYAITAHKSQGQTFDSAVYNMPFCFSPGQLYVALSRVRSLDKLYINADKIPERCLITSPHVVEFYSDFHSYPEIRKKRRMEFEENERRKVREAEARRRMNASQGVSYKVN